MNKETIVILNALRCEADAQARSETPMTLLLSEALHHVADHIEEELHALELEEREEREGRLQRCYE